jgi:multidrug efflux pump subunit AcrA (membrane-fusion protein)
MNRNRLVGGALGLVVGAGAIGWIAGATITSPAEAAARAQPPTPSLITADVDQRVLSADIIARGSIDFDDPISLSLKGSVGGDVETQIVTAVPEVGTELTDGSVALEVAGRPVILLTGDLPVYRDLRPGSSGDDVEQLELALNRLGLLSNPDRTWGPETGAAIQALYANAGYTANTTSDADRDALDAARDASRMANQAVQDAQKALNEAGGATGSSLVEAQNGVADAQASLTAATAARTAAIASANGDLTIAQQELTDANTSGTPAPGTPDYIALQNAVTNAQNAVTAVTAEQDALVRSAQSALDVAKARLKEAQSPGDTTALRRALEDARRQQTDASAQLVEAEKKAGTWIPAGELIFVKRLPVQVNDTSVSRGETVSGSFMTVSGADIAMTVGVSEQDARRLEVGDKVIIDEPDLLEEPIEAFISEIPEGGSSGRVQMTVSFENLPDILIGSNVRVIIPVESTAGEVLVVPAAALSSVANGDVRVEVEDPEKPGTTRFVTVVTGLAADGVVEVRPVDGSLKKGDRVVVGKADIGPKTIIDDEDEDAGPSSESDDADQE